MDEQQYKTYRRFRDYRYALDEYVKEINRLKERIANTAVDSPSDKDNLALAIEQIEQATKRIEKSCEYLMEIPNPWGR